MYLAGVYVDIAHDFDPPVKVWALRFVEEFNATWRPLTDRNAAITDAQLSTLSDSTAAGFRLAAEDTRQRANECAAHGHGCRPKERDLWSHWYWRKERLRRRQLLPWCELVADYNESVCQTCTRTKLSWGELWRGQYRDFEIQEPFPDPLLTPL